MINNYDYYYIHRMDSFNEYKKRHSKYKKKMEIEKFLLICRISFILGEPIKNVVKGFTDFEEDVFRDSIYNTV